MPSTIGGQGIVDATEITRPSRQATVVVWPVPRS